MTIGLIHYKKGTIMPTSNFKPAPTFQPQVFGPSWDFPTALASRRTRQAINEQNKSNTPQETPDSSLSGAFLEMMVPTLFSMIGLPTMGELLHISEIVVPEFKKYNWSSTQELNRIQQFSPAWYGQMRLLQQQPEAPKSHTIHENLNRPVVKGRSFGSYGGKRKS